MSEYQYYEFRALDRPLTREQMAALRALSTRAEITSRRFFNEYNYGDFKGDPEKLMRAYFDAFLYFANWGTHRLMFRFPAGAVSEADVRPYCNGETLFAAAQDGRLILEFTADDENRDQDFYAEDPLEDMLPLRDDILNGDFRALYIGWLAFISTIGHYREHLDLEKPEPPVPPGLQTLTAPLTDLADFLYVDSDRLEVAALTSPAKSPPPPRTDPGEWVKNLPAGEKDQILIRLLGDEDPAAVRAGLAAQLRKSLPRPAATNPPDTTRRTIGELLEARDALADRKAREALEKAARDQEEREQEAARKREKRLEGLTRREPEAWVEVEKLIALKRPAEYDQAVALIADLCEIAQRAGRGSQAHSRVTDIRLRHAKKTSFVEKLRARGLT